MAALQQDWIDTELEKFPPAPRPKSEDHSLNNSDSFEQSQASSVNVSSQLTNPSQYDTALSNLSDGEKQKRRQQKQEAVRMKKQMLKAQSSTSK